MSEREAPGAPTASSSPAATAPDPERDAIVGSELVLLERTQEALASAQRRIVRSYDQELVALRDEIAEARAEDLPPLMQQMERLQGIAARRAEVPAGKVDANSPYFGHLRLKEGERTRDVLIGNTTYIDTERGVRIVDWRDAPVSKLYYRYAEGDEYEEEIAGRTLEGEVLVRRSVVIAGSVLRKVITPQGTFTRGAAKDASPQSWRRLDASATKLSGGQGVAERPPALEEYSVRRGRLGVRIAGREDRHLPQIPALIDPRQFELLSKPASGLVVIQGGAGSGKTTIGLHRIAYLNYNDPRRFSPDKLLVVVFNDALASYISRVLPSLGVEGVQVITFSDWASRQRKRHLSGTPQSYAEDTPPAVTRVKKHPVMLTLIDERVAREGEALRNEIARAMASSPSADRVRAALNAFAKYTPAQQVTALGQWLRGERDAGGATGSDMPSEARLKLEAVLDRVRPRSRDVLWDWAELLTDRAALRDGFDRLAPDAVSDTELAMFVRYCTERVSHVAGAAREEREEREREGEGEGGEKREREKTEGAVERDEALAELEPSERPSGRHDGSGPGPGRGRGRGRDADDDDDDDGPDPYRAIDGVDEREKIPVLLDQEDDALLLRLYQRKRGPLRKDRKTALLYEHVFVDEAQDLSPVEMAVLLDCVTPARSVTLAGDTAQRLLLDNGFTDWKGVLKDLGLSSVSVEPLKIGYRSTCEVLEFARAVLGPLADPEPPVATRSGAPVEMHRFPDVGAAVAFLGEALRELSLSEPRASVAVVAREPERADLYFEGLKRAEVPRLSRVRAQDFSFKPGVEVTDIRQVKGLEFDYVVLVDVTAGRYPADHESRHLLHIGATRAAHQLWLVAAGEPSPLLPPALRD